MPWPITLRRAPDRMNHPGLDSCRVDVTQLAVKFIMSELSDVDPMVRCCE